MPPPLYPHLITLAPQVTVAEVVSELVPRTGSWVKDSFATLGLAEHGFSVIVQAWWLHRTPGSADGGVTCSVVRSGDELALDRCLRHGRDRLCPASSSGR